MHKKKYEFNSIEATTADSIILEAVSIDECARHAIDACKSIDRLIPAKELTRVPATNHHESRNWRFVMTNSWRRKGSARALYQ
jgi:hypothetical protein